MIENPLAHISPEQLLQAADIVDELDESDIDLLNDSVSETLRGLAGGCDCYDRHPELNWSRHAPACPLDGEQR